MNQSLVTSTATDGAGLGRLLTAERVMWILDVSARTLYDLEKKRLLASIKFGNEKRYEPRDVRQFIEAHKRKARAVPMPAAEPNDDEYWQRMERLISVAVDNRLAEVKPNGN